MHSIFDKRVDQYLSKIDEPKTETNLHSCFKKDKKKELSLKYVMLSFPSPYLQVFISVFIERKPNINSWNSRHVLVLF